MSSVCACMRACVYAHTCALACFRLVDADAFVGHGEWSQGLLVFIDGVGVYRPW